MPKKKKMSPSEKMRAAMERDPFTPSDEDQVMLSGPMNLGPGGVTLEKSDTPNALESIAIGAKDLGASSLSAIREAGEGFAQAASDLHDYSKSKEGGWIWSLLPVAAEALSGGNYMGEAATASAQGIQSYQDRLLALDKLDQQRKLAGQRASRYRPIKEVKEIAEHSADQKIRAARVMSKLTGKGITTGVDPITGEKYTLHKGTGRKTIIPAGKMSVNSPAFMKKMDSISKEWRKESNEYVDKYNKVDLAIKNMKKGDLGMMIALKSIVSTTEKGKLTDKDVEFILERISLLDKLKENFSKATKGERPELEREAESYLLDIKDRVHMRANERMSSHAKSLGGDDEEMRFHVMKKLSPYLETVEKRQDAYKSKASSVKGKPGKGAPPVGFVDQGMRYKGGDHTIQSNWERVE